jgi:hypothetical protein
VEEGEGRKVKGEQRAKDSQQKKMMESGAGEPMEQKKCRKVRTTKVALSNQKLFR